MRRRALWTAIWLSIFFLLVYGTTNEISAHRNDVGAWFFEWERSIPYVGWMAIPYLSIDLFFVVAPFLCVDRRELRMLAWRIVLAIVVAAACFLAMPLRLEFEATSTPDALGRIFDAFRALDRPHNLLPSLHIALGVILAEHYATHSRGALRGAFVAWFVIVGASTLFTHRHHVVDLAAGAVLGVMAIYAVARPCDAAPVRVREPRLALRYAGASVIFAATAAFAWPWSGVLLWPSLALLIVAIGYAGAGTLIFRKCRGAIAWSARIVLAPVLIGHRLSWLWYSRRNRAWDEPIPRLRIGRTLTAREGRRAIADGLGAVLDLTSEGSECAPLRRVCYRNLQVMDLTAPSPGQIDDGVSFIDERLSRGESILVHCKAGYSRSAVLVAAHLIRSGVASSADDAIATLERVRPGIVIRPEARAAIRAFAARRAATNEAEPG